MKFSSAFVFRFGLLLSFVLSSFVISSVLAADIRNAAPKPQTTSTNDPIYIEYMRILTMDDAAEKQIDAWIKESEEFERLGLMGSKLTLKSRIDQKLKEVRDAYDNFILKNPKHVDARIAYASFLMETGSEEDGVRQLEIARDLEPNNPTPWNNLANYYGHWGPVEKAFPYYEKAIQLDTNEVVYVQNLATTTYLFRKDAKEYYKTNEAGVFDIALALYKQAMRLDPTNLTLAVDYAQSYYGIKPLRTNDALLAWTNALKLAKTDLEKEGIYLHLARVELNTGRFEEARSHLNLVTNAELQELKQRLDRNLQSKQKQAGF